MSKLMEFKDYIYDNELDLERIVDDYLPYVRTIVNNMVNRQFES